MSTSRIHARRRSARALILSVLVATGLLAAAASAQAAVSLKWTQANVFNTSAASGYDRTFLGYTTNSTDMGAGPPSGGTVTPSAGATGDTVTTASARGASELYSNTFAPISGSVSGPSSAPTGTLQFSGTVTYVVNGVVATVINPRIVLAGDGTGQLFATGYGITGMTGAAYDDSTPMLNLDFNGAAPDGGAPASQPGLQAGYSAAYWQVNSDGSLSLEGIVPSVATINKLYGSSYAVGSGPDRIPNRFGTLSLQVAAPAAPPSNPTGPSAGTAVDKAIVLKKAPFSKRSRLVAKVFKGKTLVGYASVVGRKVRFTIVGSELKGTYTLVETSGKKRKVKVTIG